MLCSWRESEDHIHEFRTKVEEISCSYVSVEQKKKSIANLYDVLREQIFWTSSKSRGQSRSEEAIKKYEKMLIERYGSVEAADRAMLKMIKG
ncbi:MAG: hypothetical protein KatS3mg109_0023 [Pirellulaceae bacterium]|nr:MAG: hypothetical protein KatS3mg109_0023 [Pirellulaceae bacterium]